MTTLKNPLSQTEKDFIIQIRKTAVELQTPLSIPELTEKLKVLSENNIQLNEEYESERCDQQLKCLKKSLQAAVTLEFATIPPYLTALWSIDEDDSHPVVKSIKAVVAEEMLHMALACNMLTALGEEPQISNAVPQYPGALPGGVHKGLEVTLMGLNKKSLNTFLWIERPLEQVPIDSPYTELNKDDFDLDTMRPLHNSQFLIFISTFTIFQKRFSKILHIFHKNLKIACLSSFFLLCFFIFNLLPLIGRNNPVDDSSA